MLAVDSSSFQLPSRRGILKFLTAYLVDTGCLLLVTTKKWIKMAETARYQFQKLLGSGSYGVVASFRDTTESQEVAVKRVPGSQKGKPNVDR